MLDKTDKIILEELQIDADRKIHELEKATKLPRSTIHNRIRKLKNNGSITRIQANIDPRKLGLNLLVQLQIVTVPNKTPHEIARKLATKKNVEAVNLVAGEFDINMRIWFRDTAELADFLVNDKTGIRTWEGIVRTESTIFLENIKDHGILE
jgi:DNA-binding Lrp family transcriptional regulator